MSRIGKTLTTLTASEWMYLLGLVLLACGLVMWLGWGVALSVAGGVLIITALLNSWMTEGNNVI